MLFCSFRDPSDFFATRPSPRGRRVRPEDYGAMPASWSWCNPQCRDNKHGELTTDPCFDIRTGDSVTCGVPFPRPLLPDETHLPTQSATSQTASRLPTPDAHPRRSRRAQGETGKGPEASRCLSTNRSGAPRTSVESWEQGTEDEVAGSCWSASRVGSVLLESDSSSPEAVVAP